MLDIDQLKERIRIEASTLERDQPLSSSFPPSPPLQPVLSRLQRLRRRLERTPLGCLLKPLAWFFRPWRITGPLQTGIQQLHEHCQRLDADLADQAAELKELAATIRQDITQLQYGLNLSRQQDVLRGYELQRLMDDLHREAELSEDTQTVLAAHADDRLDSYFLAFADACRGSERDIKGGLLVYIDYLVKHGLGGSDTPVLDLGSGRGEWLSLLSEQGLVGAGVDMAQAMVDHCRNVGLTVECADALTFLGRQDDESLGAITGFHIIEHLPFALLYRLLAECCRVLRPGGMIIFETPNPENPLVGSHTFYHDPSHRNPLTPTGTEFLVRYHGFESIEILRLHPYPESARLPGTDLLTERINGLLCGHQDFAIIATKP